MLRSAQRDTRSDNTQMSSCIFEAVIGQIGATAMPPMASRGQDGMDVNATPTGGKGKEQDKCQICGKPNHTAKDYYWRDEGKSKGDGKARGAGAGGKMGYGKDIKGK
eukprot:1729859-Pyramimonas_sp.AAC.1